MTVDVVGSASIAAVGVGGVRVGGSGAMQPRADFGVAHGARRLDRPIHRIWIEIMLRLKGIRGEIAR